MYKTFDHQSGLTSLGVQVDVSDAMSYLYGMPYKLSS